MQFKSLATVLFAAMAVASPAPAPQATDSSFDMSDLLGSVPSSILAVVATAIPASFISAMANPTSVSSIVSEIEAGTYPAWYSSLPDSVKAWATSAALAELGADATATATGDSESSTGSSGAAATATQTSSGSSSSTGTASSAQTTSSSSSSASESSSAAASTTSSHNAGATGAVAVSFAGAAGLLAVALAL
ncbi:uncharacterized protein CDV56_108032 [Aspergillus thermomutatus]|uniref:Uncharacterized protein n=1 Tax=Aspergillus thermomutatus TaxID=41047 RepID=A0A397GZ63_ASPTH|nr:uncharacterized protein CDV56_108032 [Aspergillus thermomutatus]RHZ56292.1 hypothetical protein CDV56_108032 [Aspergillus thermomutatus]